MEPTQASEYRKGRTKLVTVASGATFRIRKAPPQTVLRLFKAFGIKVKASDKERQIKERIAKLEVGEKVESAMSILLPDCVIEPKVILKGNPKGNEVLIEELHPLDAFDLLDEVVDFSGLSEEAAKTRESFRQKRSR